MNVRTALAGNLTKAGHSSAMKIPAGRVMKIFRMPAWALLLVLVVLSVVPATDRPQTGFNHNLEHFLPFVLVGILFALGYENHLPRLLIGGFLFTGLIELVQIPLPSRHARLEDFIVDLTAIALGLCVTNLGQKFFGSWRRRGATP
jgi:VanZ family protein